MLPAIQGPDYSIEIKLGMLKVENKHFNNHIDYSINLNTYFDQYIFIKKMIEIIFPKIRI